MERVRRRMCYLGLKGIQYRKFKRKGFHDLKTTYAPNLLNQVFDTPQANTAWVGDITYIRVKQHWLYLAVVLDLYSRKIIGWSLSEHINADLVCKALKSALVARGHPQQVIMHTDRGSQYTSRIYQQMIHENALKCSMSGQGNCYDNAVCESFFHTLKVEHIYPRVFDTVDHAHREIFWYIEVYYNRKRKHSGIHYYSPVDFEEKRLVTV